MEIRAKISFKHARIIETIKKNGFTVKEFAFLCGWNPQVLGNFINFQTGLRQQKPEKLDTLFVALKKLDNTIDFKDIFPDGFDKYREAFSTRIKTKKIAIEDLLEKEDIECLEIEDKTIIDAAQMVETKDVLSMARTIINSRERFILSNYFNGKTLGQVGGDTKLTRERVRLIRDHALRKIRNNPRFRKCMDLIKYETKIKNEKTWWQKNHKKTETKIINKPTPETINLAIKPEVKNAQA